MPLRTIKTNKLSKLLFITIVLITHSSVYAKNTSPFIFGLLLVGPYNDHGWSQAHFEACEYVQKKVPGARMIYIDKVNPADRPGITIAQLVDNMVSKGAKLVIANSDDMKDGIREAALQHPSIHFIHISGDDVLTGKAPPNLSNLMGRMEYGKMMAGFVAAMTTRTGKIAYLGPLINDETRRLAVSCFLGAKYAWKNVRHKNPKDLQFKISWIGFWFNIPGVTLDPTQLAQNFFNTNFDVVVSGIDTPEAVIVAKQMRQKKKTVWAIPYDYAGACDGYSKVCLGVPYFNWGPEYITFIKNSMAGKWTSRWRWVGPDWKNINNVDVSSVGFKNGPALSKTNKAALAAFIEQLGNGSLNLFTGPLKYQDGTTFLKKGETATDNQIWYLKQFLNGMDGQSQIK